MVTLEGERGASAHRKGHRGEKMRDLGAAYFAREVEQQAGGQQPWEQARAQTGREPGDCGDRGCMTVFSCPQSWLQIQEMDVSIILGLNLARKPVAR